MRPELEPFGWIAPHADGSFSFAEEGDGIFACLLPVVGLDGGVHDVVAWALGEPARWWLYCRATAWLGYHEMLRAELRLFASGPWSERKPIRMVSTPAEWLRDAGEALCVLNWCAAISPLVDLAGEIVCASPALERRLRDKLAAEATGRVRSRRAAA